MEHNWTSRCKDSITQDELIFQCLDWHCEDIDQSEDNESGPSSEYKIFVFGVTQTGTPISLMINGFYPFFFIEVPIGWDSNCKHSVSQALNFKGIKSIEFLERKKYYGFENNKLRKFLKLTFWNSRSMRNLRYRIKDTKYMISGREYSFDLYESNIDPLLRFTHLRDILTAGWIKVSKFNFDEEEQLFTCEYRSVEPLLDDSFENKIAPFRTLYFDIEACSEDGSFPNALKPNDRVTQICCIISDLGGTSQSYLFNLDTCDPIEGTVVNCFKTEKKLLINYAQFINDLDPDIIVGYNIFGFDNGYLFERAKVLGIEHRFNYQSKINRFTEITKKILNNQQSGFNEWKMTRLYGRIHIDLLQVIKKDFKLESYKLNNVGEHFLGEGKDDVTPREIFEAWSNDDGTTAKRTRVGKYCVQDTMLCLKLFEKFAVLANHIEMAKVTRVPVEYLITRGQSIKVFSQIAYQTRKSGFLIPVLPQGNKDSKFQGATVLDAKIGYYQKPVAGLDFASLYPSIMIAHNMCYSTIVLDPKYLEIPGVEYSHIEWVGSGESEEPVNFKFSFVQSKEGVLSGILQSLWKNRKVTKKQMNATTDPFVKTVLNAKQLAIKVSMNSIYGFTGAVVGALPCLGISQSVTGCGRQMIEQTSSLARERFNCEVIYGDSVTPDTPILLKINGIVKIMAIQELFERYPRLDYPQFKPDELDTRFKQQSMPSVEDVQVWTSSGWSKVVRTIRHLCHKRLYRIHTHIGLVDVTEDHSLLNEYLVEMKPLNLSWGQALFHSYPSIDELDLCYRKPYQQGDDIQSKVNIPIKYFRTKDKLEAARYYLDRKLENKDLEITFNNDEIIIKVNDTLVPMPEHTGDGTQWPGNLVTFNPRGKKSIKEVKYLGFNNMDYVYDIETEVGNFQAGVGEMIVKNTDSCYVIFPEQVNPDGTLKNLFKLAETAAAEISKTFKKPIELEFEKFMYPLILVAKKRYMYVEWTNPDAHNGCIEAKGVELVRRDNCPYVKETLDSVLNPIMFKNNLELGVLAAQEHIDRLLNGEVDIKKLVLSKNLRADYKGYTKTPDGKWMAPKTTEIKVDGKKVKTLVKDRNGKQVMEESCPTMAHVALVEKIRTRDPNSAPKPGDRVPFVYVDIGDPKALAAAKVEDPSWVMSNNLPIDTLYYLEHQLKNPLKTIFDILLGETRCEQLFQRKSLTDAKAREKVSIGEAKRVKERNKDIRSFFSVKIV